LHHHKHVITRKWFPLESAKRATKLDIALHNIAPVIHVLNPILSFTFGNKHF